MVLFFAKSFTFSDVYDIINLSKNILRTTMFIFAVIFVISLIILLDGILTLMVGDKIDKMNAWPKIHVAGLMIIFCILKFYVGE